MTAKLDLLTPMDAQITVRQAAQQGRVTIKELRDYLRDVLHEDWLDADNTVEPVLAAAAVAVVKMNREHARVDAILAS